MEDEIDLAGFEFTSTISYPGASALKYCFFSRLRAELFSPESDDVNSLILTGF